jgi:hypothetical protein
MVSDGIISLHSMLCEISFPDALDIILLSNKSLFTPFAQNLLLLIIRTKPSIKTNRTGSSDIQQGNS